MTNDQLPAFNMNSTAAIFYKRDGYDTSSNRLLGRQAAGEGFLKGWVQFSTADTVIRQNNYQLPVTNYQS